MAAEDAAVNNNFLMKRVSEDKVKLSAAKLNQEMYIKGNTGGYELKLNM